MRALKWLWKHTIFYEFYDLCVSVNEYFSDKDLIADTLYSDAFKIVMKNYLNLTLKKDWIGRLYGVVNPIIDKDGHFDASNMIIEIDGDNTNTNEWVKAWAYKQLRLVAQLFKIEKLYDYIDVEFTHVGPENFDNYLIVFDIVSRKVLADSAKRFFLHFTVLSVIAAVVCACIFLI